MPASRSVGLLVASALDAVQTAASDSGDRMHGMALFEYSATAARARLWLSSQQKPCSVCVGDFASPAGNCAMQRFTSELKCCHGSYGTSGQANATLPSCVSCNAEDAAFSPIGEAGIADCTLARCPLDYWIGWGLVGSNDRLQVGGIERPPTELRWRHVPYQAPGRV